AFSPDGKRVVSASKDSTLKVWDADTGKELLTLKAHSREVTSVDFSPITNSLLTTAHDETAIHWLTGPSK
ncbi:MAG: hypothetical protein KDA89_10310, partial [Planctomycetaceae bacterium]|nr:hypothetical protein [Planctomycetaceae bacterium]